MITSVIIYHYASALSLEIFRHLDPFFFETFITYDVPTCNDGAMSRVVPPHHPFSGSHNNSCRWFPIQPVPHLLRVVVVELLVFVNCWLSLAILFGSVCWLLNGGTPCWSGWNPKGSVLYPLFCHCFRLFRHRVGRLWWVIRIRRLLPFFGGGCGSMLGQKWLLIWWWS
jgi:hypothetical protein